MGSEMCIRDRPKAKNPAADDLDLGLDLDDLTGANLPAPKGPKGCLLYTSDAADERSSVDLGGRRIIKKKTKKCTTHRSTHDTKQTHKRGDGERTRQQENKSETQ